MFVDNVKIKAKAGNGGSGAISFHREKFVQRGGPDGGDGGKGGNVVFVAKSGLNTLFGFRFNAKFYAEDGKKGDKKNQDGKDGKDIVVEVPQGTLIKDEATGKIVADMFENDKEVVILRGGRGGRGNSKFASARRQSPHFSQTGEISQEFNFILELKTIADVGLVGYPSVGKSTLLKALTNANPKIAAYHFTTLSPNLGVASYFENNFVIADIPGLIEGASEGAGLGHEFLKHIERVRLIVHMVDISGSEERDPFEDYKKINEELRKFSDKLNLLPQIVVLSKIDLLTEEKTIAEFKKKLPKNAVVVPISAITNTGLDELKKAIYENLKVLPPIEPMIKEQVIIDAKDIHSFEVKKLENGTFEVVGGYVDNLIRGVVLSDPHSFAYFQKKIKESGIQDKLRECGARNGDTIKIGCIEFEMNDSLQGEYNDYD
ncbi:MAG: GTPase ObgE [Clostridia bacterium]